ncbi:ADP-ribosylglycohydrolase family protein [Gammaproteobacteria bacterium]|nr:ADP-ribosylglycohydrolase family protein [Gammaproteobacteria bacterium]
MATTADYAEQVYAGVLGKVIGVYLGRPFEGWSYERIQQRLGDIDYYVHDKLDVPLIVTDDDIAGTFTFLRALEDHGTNPDISSKDIGESWLNYLIKNRSVLWWGGLGQSTEHTAYLRLASGIEAPLSGSMAMNGQVVAEQIGAQIFIDGWAMVAPGDPDQAVRFAEAAARVSHDGEAVYGAKMLAAMESMAFVENDIQQLIDIGLTYIPKDSVIARMIADLRAWHEVEKDWRGTRELLAANYGYDKYGGNCHMVPNHGLIIHSLLHGDGDFSKTLKIVNTCGWDTDCNSGNVGCLMGILVGVEGIDAGLDRGFDWRGPVADRLYSPTADGDRCISDCAREATQIINMGRTLAGEGRFEPKQGAQFHFTFKGSVQGFQVKSGTAQVSNPSGGSLRIAGEAGARVGTPVFAPSVEVAEYFEKSHYTLMASPRIFPGQHLRAGLSSPDANLYVAYYGENDEVCFIDVDAPDDPLKPSIQVPCVYGPIFEVGVRLNKDISIELDHLGWRGNPHVVFERPKHRGRMWKRAWVDAVDQLVSWTEMFRLVQNEGLGMISQGTREWTNYIVRADVTPHLATRAGIAARVQGLTRFYALMVTRDQKVQLVKSLHQESVLAESEFGWSFGDTLHMSLGVDGDELWGEINGQVVLSARDSSLDSGAIGLVIADGRSATHKVEVTKTD